MSENDPAERPGRAGPRAIPARRGKQPSGGRRGTLVLLGLIVVGVLGAVILGPRLFGGPASDFSGEGREDILITVNPGETTTQIAENLRERNVVANVEGFLQAAQGNADIAAIQPGYYKLRTEIPPALAVQKLTDPANRVGKLVIPEGRQLDDITMVGTGAVTDGIFTLIAEASCVELNGTRSCVSAQDLRAAAGAGPLSSLNVPDWAVAGAEVMGNSHRRLEGLIAPGAWNVDPLAAPGEILATLVAESADHYVAGGLLDAATTTQMSPYEVLIVGSLVQKEAKPADFAKVARVIYNRLNSDYDRLEFDSTVNYPLDRQEVATTDADRKTETPWNTYAKAGLPATPICSPGDEALGAAENPAPGDWLYFVTVDKSGTTLFTSDYQQHLANREQALSSGILDSGR